MDEMKLKLKTKFMRGMISKIVSKIVSKNLGCKVNLNLNDIEIEMIDGDVILHLDVDGTMDKYEFNKIIKNIGLDD